MHLHLPGWSKLRHGVSQNQGYFFGGPHTKVTKESIVFWGLYGGLPIWGKYHMVQQERKIWVRTPSKAALAQLNHDAYRHNNGRAFFA